MSEKIVEVRNYFSLQDVNISTQVLGVVEMMKFELIWRWGLLDLYLILYFKFIRFFSGSKILDGMFFGSFVFIDGFSIMNHFLWTHKPILVFLLHFYSHLWKMIKFLLSVFTTSIMFMVPWFVYFLITMSLDALWLFVEGIK